MKAVNPFSPSLSELQARGNASIADSKELIGQIRDGLALQTKIKETFASNTADLVQLHEHLLDLYSSTNF